MVCILGLIIFLFFCEIENKLHYSVTVHDKELQISLSELFYKTSWKREMPVKQNNEAIIIKIMLLKPIFELMCIPLSYRKGQARKELITHSCILYQWRVSTFYLSPLIIEALPYYAVLTGVILQCNNPGLNSRVLL